jgi:heme exporter protein A
MIASLSIQNLSISRGVRRLFEGLSLEVRAGEAVMLAGANGAGKTSLLRAVAGLLRPDGGVIAFSGANGEIEAEVARSDHLHFAGHHDGLKAQRRAGEEISFWADWLGGAGADRDSAVTAYDLGPLLELEVRVLSAGQRRRLALSRLRLSPRSLWLLDEPLAPLDAGWRARFGAEMAAHLAAGGMILAAAHDPLPVPHRLVEVGA